MHRPHTILLLAGLVASSCERGSSVGCISWGERRAMPRRVGRGQLGFVLDRSDRPLARTLAILRGGQGKSGDQCPTDGANLASDGIKAMASQTKMFTGIRERRERSTKGFFDAPWPSPQAHSRPIHYVYIVSDSTGFTASHALTSCMTQFEDIAVDWHETADDHGEEPPEEAGCIEVRTQMFSNVNEWGRLDRIVQLASKMDAFIVFTLVDPQLNARMVDKCQTLNIQHWDLLGPLVSTISDYLAIKPSGRPKSSAQERRRPLSDKYFQRIAAVEFTIKHDDGNLPENHQSADVVLLGVSRTGKTPLSTYLAQQFGYKMGNVPVIKDMPMDKTIFNVDPRKVFGLTMSPSYLKRIRSRRLAATGVDKSTIGVKDGSADYDSLQFIASEVAWGLKLYDENPQWSVLDVTGRSVEENSAIITELLAHPGKTTPVEEALLRARETFFLAVVTDSQTGVTPAGLPRLLASDALLAAARCSRSDTAAIGESEDFVARLLSAADGSKVCEVRDAVVQGRQGWSKVKAKLSATADEVEAIARTTPLYDDTGSVAYVICTVASVSGQRHSSQPLGMAADDSADARRGSSSSDLGYVEDGDALLQKVVESKKRLFAVDDKVAARISEFVLEAGSSYPVCLSSERFAGSCGRSTREVIGAPLSQFYGQNTDQYTIDMIRSCLDRGDPVSTALVLYDKAGVGSWRHIYLEPVYSGQSLQPVLYVGVQLQ